MYHYYKIFLNQVSSKMIYYANRVEAEKEKRPAIINGREYYDKTFLKLSNPFRIHMFNNWPSWLEKFEGEHPRQVAELLNDMSIGKVRYATRNMKDVDVLVNTNNYKIGIYLWKIWGNYISQSGWLLKDLIRCRIGFSEFTRSLLLILTAQKRLFYSKSS